MLVHNIISPNRIIRCGQKKNTKFFSVLLILIMLLELVGGLFLFPIQETEAFDISVGEKAIFSSTSSDSDIDTATDTVKLFVCKTNSLTSCSVGCGSGEWCHSSATSSDASCEYTILITDSAGDYDYYGFICDNHDFESADNPRSGTFTINPSISFDVIDTTADLGVLNSTAVSSDSTTFTTAANSSSGYVVTVSGNTLTHSNESDTITAIGATATSSSAGTEQFGINLKDNSAPNVGANPSSGSGAAYGEYATVDDFAFNSGDTIASSSGTSDTTTFTISYIGNITDTTEPGDYSTTLTLIATGTY